MTNKQKKEKLEQINEKFRSLLEPYADQLRNTGLIVEWFPDEDYPDCSSFSCSLTKNELDEGDEFIGVCINAPEMDWEHPEKYDLEKKTIVWYDWFNAWQYKVITQPHIFRHSLFDEVFNLIKKRFEKRKKSLKNRKLKKKR